MRKVTIFILSFACFVASVEAVPTYRIRDLGDLPGGQNQSFAVDINNNGWIVGEVSAPGGPRAAVWKRKRNGAYVLVNLGVNRGHDSSLANSINADNTIVGRSSLVGDLSTSIGVRWILAKNGKYVARVLGTECESQFAFTGTQAFSINDSGSIVGVDGDCSFIWKKGAGIKRLFQSQDGTIEFLVDVNKDGIAVGTSHDPVCCHPTPVIRNTRNNSISILPVEEVGHFKGFAEGINSRGYVVGQLGEHFLGCCDTDAVIWSPTKDGKYTAEIISPEHSPDAFTTEAIGRDINKHNQVVGSFETLDGVDAPKTYAFYWTKGSGFLDLNKLVARKDPLRGKFTLQLHKFCCVVAENGVG